jgi:hypothetical protein
LYGAEISTLRKADQKYRESIEIWCWRRMERSVGQIVCNRKKYIEEPSRKGHPTYNKTKEG